MTNNILTFRRTLKTYQINVTRAGDTACHFETDRIPIGRAAGCFVCSLVAAPRADRYKQRNAVVPVEAA